MSAVKREIERIHSCRAAAVSIALRVGLLEKCEVCGEVKDPQSCNFQDAYKLANFMMSKGDELTAGFNDRRELTDTIKSQVESTSEHCECDRLMARDD